LFSALREEETSPRYYEMSLTSRYDRERARTSGGRQRLDGTLLYSRKQGMGEAGAGDSEPSGIYDLRRSAVDVSAMLDQQYF